MGLVIRAYSNVTLLDVDYDEDEEIASDRRTGERITFPVVYTRITPNFPGRNDNIEHNRVYAYEQSEVALDLSYSGFGWFRHVLARISTVDFDELLHFSDCEGIIGPVTSAKLYEAFKKHASVAENFDTEIPFFSGAYDMLQTGFKLASQNGFIAFR